MGYSDGVVAVRSNRRDSADTSGERRLRPRVFVDLEVDPTEESNFVFAYLRDIHATGIFVYTTTPEAPGTNLNVRFRSASSLSAAAGTIRARLDDCTGGSGGVGDALGIAETLDGDELDGLDGEVIWINPYRPDDNDNLNPGMGIRLVDLTDPQRRRLIALFRGFAYLDDP